MTTLSGISQSVERTVHLFSYTLDMFMHGKRFDSRLLDSFAISRLKMLSSCVRVCYVSAMEMHSVFDKWEAPCERCDF